MDGFDSLNEQLNVTKKCLRKYPMHVDDFNTALFRNNLSRNYAVVINKQLTYLKEINNEKY